MNERNWRIDPHTTAAHDVSLDSGISGELEKGRVESEEKYRFLVRKKYIYNNHLAASRNHGHPVYFYTNAYDTTHA